MSPNEKNDSVQLTGKVTTGNFSKGSKSEHDAIYLETEKGSFVLRRKGENPFEDPVLKKLIGKTISANGMIHNKIFFVSDVKVV